ncbi:MAG: hypothetical protein U9Q98_06420 [Bacteroidota bacterium]|nr:hypothetical protein [Bacteroidota bacterium]
MINDIPVNKLKTSFLKGKLIQTYSDLETISGCEGRTLQRKIKKCKLLASYNKNSKFYTLPELVVFNDFGIWQYHGVLFSKQGNLYQTIVYLIDQSTSGYTSGELGQIVEVKTDDALRILTNQKRLQREKNGSYYVYYSIDDQKFRAQKNNRFSDFLPVAQPYLPKDKNIIISVLVEIIHSNTLSVESLVRRLKKRNIEASEQQIHGIILHYHLKKN